MHNPLNRSIIAEAEWSQESSRSASAISAATADHSRVDRQPRQDWDDESGGGQPRRTSHFWAARPPSDGRPARSGNFVQRLTYRRRVTGQNILPATGRKRAVLIIVLIVAAVAVTKQRAEPAAFRYPVRSAKDLGAGRPTKVRSGPAAGGGSQERTRLRNKSIPGDSRR